MRGWMAWWAVGLALGCANPQPGERPEGTRTDAGQLNLVTSLQVEVSADTVRFVLHLTNPGTLPLVLEFASAARYDFEVRTPAGAEVWRWSADRMFAQVMGTDTLAGGASRQYRAAWAPGNRTGAFVALGRVLASNHAIEQRADFELRQR